jgi:outer membrane protein OmpA-like peptidoglycan-associated protein
MREAEMQISRQRRGLWIAVAACLIAAVAATAQADDCTRPKGLKGTTPHVIKFPTGSAELSPDEKAWLESAAERFQTNPSLEVCVIGQADKTGDTALNKKLALERAETVAAFLKEKGLGDKTFQVVGRGEAFGDTKDSLIGKVIEGADPADRRVEVTFYH